MSEPDLAAIRAARARLGDRIAVTPVQRWRDLELDRALGSDTEVWLKLELLQVTGTFKPRGALCVALDLDAAARERGLVTVSAGNHAIAAAWAARAVGTHACVVMPRSASPFRVERARALGADVILVDDVHEAFERCEAIEREQGRSLIHPFEGPLTALGTATLGLELCEQLPELDAVIVPIGGGGLCAGVSSAVKQAQPGCQVIGVEPEGADSMHRSFAAGAPQALERVDTIADSLGSPRCEPYSFELCRRNVDRLVRVRDDALIEAMALLFRGAKLAVEPAGAAATAALWGPLREDLRGRRVALLVCGSNIDRARYAELLLSASS